MYVTIECARCHNAHHAPLMICPVCKFGPVLPPDEHKARRATVAFLMAIAGIIGIIPATIALLYSLIFPVFTILIAPL